MTKTIACYIRCSTEEQNEASQRREIMLFLEREGFDLDRVRWFVDKSTGDNLIRDAFVDLDRLVHNGAVSAVIVYKVDRLSRKILDGLQTLGDWLEAGVRFISVTQRFDFRGAIGRMVASLLFGFAELEQENRRERQAAGIAAARERGVYRGRQRGSTKAKPARARELQRRGLSVNEIAQSLGVSRRTAHRYLASASP